MALTAENKGKEDIAMEENNRMNEQEDPQPLTDEEFAEFQKQEKRKGNIISFIIETILDFFRW